MACESCRSNRVECELKREEEVKDVKGERVLLQYLNLDRDRINR